MDISVNYKSFDTNCDDAAFKFPNVELVFPCDIDNITIIAQDKNGKAQSVKLNIDEKGKGWNIDRSEKCVMDEISEEELAESYFNGCYENGDFDEGLIKNMSLRYQISVAQIKAAIVSARHKYKTSNTTREKGERD